MMENISMNKILATAFAFLLTVGAFTINSVMAGNPPAPVNATLTCADAKSDVSLQLKVKNQGPDAVPAGNYINYSFKISTNGPTKSGSYKLEAPLEVGQTTTIIVTPVQHWNPPAQQCSATQGALSNAARKLINPF